MEGRGGREGRDLAREGVGRDKRNKGEEALQRNEEKGERIRVGMNGGGR